MNVTCDLNNSIKSVVYCTSLTSDLPSMMNAFCRICCLVTRMFGRWMVPMNFIYDADGDRRGSQHVDFISFIVFVRLPRTVIESVGKILYE